MSVSRGQLQIIVRPSLLGAIYPVTAYLAGTTLEGRGYTVVTAIEDLFTCQRAGRLAKKLEQEIQALCAPANVSGESGDGDLRENRNQKAPRKSGDWERKMIEAAIARRTKVINDAKRRSQTVRPTKAM